MRVNLDCIPCLMRQALEAARMSSDDPGVHERVLRAVAELMHETPYRRTPPEMAHEIHALVREISGNPDPYLKLKERDNRLAMEMYGWMKDTVADSDDPLHTALKMAVAGNIIDYGVGGVFDLEGTVEDVLARDFAVDRCAAFARDLESAGNLMYLADNAGEIVFDRVLIEELDGADVTVVVKGGPILNDATEDDLKAAGIRGVTVDYMGNGSPGSGPDRNDPGFIEKLKAADLVLSKGQGNYEALNGEGYIYFLLMAKCGLVARDLSVSKGDIVFCGGAR